MAASEGSRTPLTREEEDEAYTPGPFRTASRRNGSGATPPDASESSPTGSTPRSRIDEERPVSHRDLARTRRAIGTSLKSMHEEFTQLLTTTQQECATRVDTLAQLLTKDRDVTQELIKLESQKREALGKQITELLMTAGIPPPPGVPRNS